MIEFKGDLSKNSKTFLLKKQNKIQFTAVLVSAIIFLVPIVWLGIFVSHRILLFALPLLLFLAFSLITPGKRDRELFIPKCVFLDLHERTIVHQSEKLERFHMIESVEKVIDYGDWYYFVFDYADRDPYFLCQKDLLCQGTIEEFEALFEGKIERKTKL